MKGGQSLIEWKERDPNVESFKELKERDTIIYSCEWGRSKYSKFEWMKVHFFVKESEN